MRSAPVGTDSGRPHPLPAQPKYDFQRLETRTWLRHRYRDIHHRTVFSDSMHCLTEDTDAANGFTVAAGI